MFGLFASQEKKLRTLAGNWLELADKVYNFRRDVMEPAHVAELQAMADEHIGADPDSMLWGTAGTLQHWNAILARVTDAYHQRGEFAPE